MGILEEVRAAEEKSAAMKEEAKQKAAEQIRLSQAQAEKQAGEIIEVSRRKAAGIASNTGTEIKVITAKYAVLAKEENQKLKAAADANRDNAINYVLSLLKVK